MNKIHKILWDAKLGKFIVCSEKSSQKNKISKSVTVACILSLLSLTPSFSIDYEYIGGLSGDFNNQNNWSPAIPSWAFGGVNIDKLIIQTGNVVTGEARELTDVTLEVKEGSSLILSINNSETFNNTLLGVNVTGHMEINSNIINDNVSLFYRNAAAFYNVSNNINNPATLTFRGAGFTDSLTIHNMVVDRGFAAGSMYIGKSGYGNLIVDNTFLSVADRYYRDTEEAYKAELFIGYGNNSIGNVLVTNGGLLMSNALFGASFEFRNLGQTINYSNIIQSLKNVYFDNQMNNVYTSNYKMLLGHNGGIGKLEISGISLNTQKNSRALLAKGTSVGTGSGSEGYITVKNGGKLSTGFLSGYSAIDNVDDLLSYGFNKNEIQRAVTSSTIQLGVDGGYGHLEVDNATVEIGGIGGDQYLDYQTFEDQDITIGELVVGTSGTGELTINNNGQIKIGYLYDREESYIFSSGKILTDPNDPNSTIIREYYGKTILAADANATGILNFTGDNYNTQSVKASDLMLTSDISIGQGSGIINIDHNATDALPFIFDIQVSEKYDKIYNSNFTDTGTVSAPIIGQISFNQKNGVTLLKPHECRALVCDNSPTFDYSGDTNITGGELRVENLNLLSQKSHFNVGAQGHLNVQNNQIIKSLNNDGRLSLNQGLLHRKLTVNGDYSGTGELIVNSRWNSSALTSSTDRLHILGDVLPGTRTKISTPTGIILGDVNLLPANALTAYSLPVVVVDGAANTTNFYGTARTERDGYLANIAHTTGSGGENNFSWSTNVAVDPEVPVVPGIPVLPRSPTINIPILDDKISMITQMHRANQEQLRLSTGRYLERTGSYIEDTPIWIRQYGAFSSLKGKERFSHKNRIYGLQIGYNLMTEKYDNATAQAGVFINFSNNNVEFKDRYRTLNGLNIINPNSKVGNGRTQMYGLGSYYSYETDSRSYVDVVGMFNIIENKYHPSYGQHEFKQHGYGLSLSIEGGYGIQFSDTNFTLIPQAQLIYQYTHMNNQHVANIRISEPNRSTLIGRAGLQAEYAINKDFTISGTMDYYQQLNSDKSVHYGNSRFNETLNKRWGELGLAVKYNVQKDLSFYGNVAYQKNLGGEKRTGYRGNIGVKFTF